MDVFARKYSPGSLSLNEINKYVAFSPTKRYDRRATNNRLAAELNGKKQRNNDKSFWRDEDEFIVDDLINGVAKLAIIGATTMISLRVGLLPGIEHVPPTSPPLPTI